MYDRLAVAWYERKYPDRPWLTSLAISILTSWIRQSDEILEFGSGRSTLWFGKRVSALTSIEHDEEWYGKIARMAKEAGVANLDYRLIPTHEREAVTPNHQYPAAVNSFAKGSLDLVIVDGVHRDLCAIAVMPHLKPGGLLVLDNANWFLPSSSVAPGSRTLSQGPSSPVWSQFLNSVEDWRCIWTSNGVWDTALYVKPHAG